ncbi:MAG: U32 family peptidase C-terminal domain-containing protein [bacterium]|nr:U32 family peptidase C-terminal domain-containing protein [bacterium]
MPELLAPAGNLEKLRFAFAYGADGAYLAGRDYSLRAQADNFTFPELKEAARIAACLNKKLYFALNIFFRNKDLSRLGVYLERLLKINIRNIIVSDLGCLFFVQKNFKDTFHISLSTQANVTNSYAARSLQELGVRRIILARELGFGDIREIRKQTNLELETFIHGAMCVSYSGRCLLSEYFNSRSANRGDCSHPCRWEYELIELSRKGERLGIEEDRHGTYLFSSKDLMTLNILDRLIKTGVDAFKIEGRMKSLYYVANVTRVYRKAMDLILNKKPVHLTRLMEELDSVSHRPYFNGFYLKQKGSIDHQRALVRKYAFIGTVRARVKEDLYEISLKETLHRDDSIEMINPGFKDADHIRFKLFDKYMRPVDRGVITDKFYIQLDFPADEFSIIRKKIK